MNHPTIETSHFCDSHSEILARSLAAVSKRLFGRARLLPSRKCNRARLGGSLALPIWTHRLLFTIVFCLFCASLSAATPNELTTVLGIQDSHFTLNGQPTFLLGISYYGALSASEEFIRQDLDDLQRHGFNWLRAWVTWEVDGEDVSAVDARGRPREPYFQKLCWLVTECDRRGLIVDLTLAHGKVSEATGGGRLPDVESHQQAVELLVRSLNEHRNWYLDLANERDVGDDRYVGPDELKPMRALVRRLDPQRLVTASFGGHDLSERDIRQSLQMIDLDFLAPHRPRHPKSPAETEAQTRTVLQIMQRQGTIVPIHHQEPFRRGYGNWEPTADDFLVDLRGAVVGGAAGWCLHNGQQRNTDDRQPARSFDMRQRRLFDQLDAQEQLVVAEAAQVVAENRSER